MNCSTTIVAAKTLLPAPAVRNTAIRSGASPIMTIFQNWVSVGAAFRGATGVIEKHSLSNVLIPFRWRLRGAWHSFCLAIPVRLIVHHSRIDGSPATPKPCPRAVYAALCLRWSSGTREASMYRPAKMVKEKDELHRFISLQVTDTTDCSLFWRVDRGPEAADDHRM